MYERITIKSSQEMSVLYLVHNLFLKQDPPEDMRFRKSTLPDDGLQYVYPPK